MLLGSKDIFYFFFKPSKPEIAEVGSHQFKIVKISASSACDVALDIKATRYANESNPPAGPNSTEAAEQSSGYWVSDIGISTRTSLAEIKVENGETCVGQRGQRIQLSI